MVSILGFAGHLVAVKNYLALLWYQESSHRQLTRKQRSPAVVQLNDVYRNGQLAVPMAHSLLATVPDYRAFILDLDFWKTQHDRKYAFQRSGPVGEKRRTTQLGLIS